MVLKLRVMVLKLPCCNTPRRLALVDQHRLKKIACRHARQCACGLPSVQRGLAHVDGLDPMFREHLGAVVGEVHQRLIHVQNPTWITMRAAKRWAIRGHERGCLLVNLSRGPHRFVHLRTVHVVVLQEPTRHGVPSRLKRLVLEGILLLLPEDGRCLVQDVGFRDGNPLLAASKNPRRNFD
jgi:hypothetical protein